ncbi:MAG: hypothetical protein U5L72_19455 [Bacteroidales bacterium]|nr:hypothetical protein [Bacteroidales bacterium]
MEIIKPFTSWIRTFSCTDGHELIPRIARESGLKVMAGAWLGDDREHNEMEIENMIRVVGKEKCRISLLSGMKFCIAKN